MVVIDIDKKPVVKGALNGVYETMSQLIGLDNVLKLYEQVNFPTRLFSKEFVLQEVLQMYDDSSNNFIVTRQKRRIYSKNSSRGGNMIAEKKLDSK